VPDLEPGAIFAGCRIDEVAGRGGMGVVYRATDLALGRPVAIKVIGGSHAGDPEFHERFAREARMAARIDHPNVVPLYAAGEFEGRPYLIMRFVPGTDLHRELAASGALAADRAVWIVAQVASALDAAHAAGLVHRDVKPANVLLSDDHVYLTDFGLTRLATGQTSVTASGQWMGTVDYASPEQLQGRRCDARADVYALGCVLFAALTGGPPFPRGTVPATLLAHLHDPPPRVSGIAGVPPQLDRVLARALAKAPADRYPSCGDLARAALAAARGEHVTEEERSVARGSAAPGGGPPSSAPAEPPTAVTEALAPDPPTAVTAVAAPGGANGHGNLGAPAPDATVRRVAAAPGATAPRGPGPALAPGARGPLPGAGWPGAGPPPASRARERRWLRRPLTGALAVAGALAAAVALSPLAPGGTRPSGPVDDGEVRAVLTAFSDAFTNEDGAALARTLTRDAQRVTPGDRQEGRTAVTREYRRQFAANAFRVYELVDMDVDGGGVGRAEGRYRVERTGRPPITGRIVFSVVRERGTPRIALIAATPD
jgi:serine/threonine-protein kinase